MIHYSVNEALDVRASIHGKIVGISGLLTFEFENESINHWPRSEQREFNGSSIWITTGDGAISFDRDTLTRWSGKRVKMTGIFESQPETAYGHLGAFPAILLVQDIWKYHSHRDS